MAIYTSAQKRTRKLINVNVFIRAKLYNIDNLYNTKRETFQAYPNQMLLASK